ncbi:D-arabinono-1,4-lactone oxidase [Paenibacillus taiwanensis]|uniref:D-arabinono-1,4-lactone oxidase n=1 Tax=Paenibacillus taiwanensis TaxID=401638 RepID=UPI0003F99141|nr:D-arabinono-1,4-lactone oxidase [Paenibacillus taiwanensis]
MKRTGPRQWRNWSGLVRSRLQEVWYPTTSEEIAEALKEAGRSGKTIRMVGSSHSFTPLVATDCIHLSLDQMQGITSVDSNLLLANVLAGTKLKRLGDELAMLGYAQQNLGDINVQSLAGAFSSGTHGTGINFGIISTQIESLTVVTGRGDLIECSERDNAAWFKALQVSLGALGVVTDVRLHVIPAARMHYQSSRMSLEQCLYALHALCTTNRHFEFYWFPYTDQVQVKVMNTTEAAATKSRGWNILNKLVIENGVFWLMSELCRAVPQLSAAMSRISAACVPIGEEVGAAHKLFATPRLVRFHEMEYSVPADALPSALEEIRECILRKKHKVHFPIECRYVRNDDIWLSPAFGRDSAYIAVHMYKGMPFGPYFEDVERILLRYEGRPHWGKLHHLRAEQLKTLYPRWDDFLQVRKELDPQGILLNPYLKSVFGID